MSCPRETIQETRSSSSRSESTRGANPAYAGSTNSQKAKAATTVIANNTKEKLKTMADSSIIPLRTAINTISRARLRKLLLHSSCLDNRAIREWLQKYLLVRWNNVSQHHCLQTGSEGFIPRFAVCERCNLECDITESQGERCKVLIHTGTETRIPLNERVFAQRNTERICEDEVYKEGWWWSCCKGTIDAPGCTKTHHLLRIDTPPATSMATTPPANKSLPCSPIIQSSQLAAEVVRNESSVEDNNQGSIHTPKSEETKSSATHTSAEDVKTYNVTCGGLLQKLDVKTIQLMLQKINAQSLSITNLEEKVRSLEEKRKEDAQEFERKGKEAKKQADEEIAHNRQALTKRSCHNCDNRLEEQKSKMHKYKQTLRRESVGEIQIVKRQAEEVLQSKRQANIELKAELVVERTRRQKAEKELKVLKAKEEGKRKAIGFLNNSAKRRKREREELNDEEEEEEREEEEPGSDSEYYHPGYKNVSDELELWCDWDVSPNGYPEIFEDDPDHQQGFIWSCCQNWGGARGCQRLR